MERYTKNGSAPRMHSDETTETQSDVFAAQFEIGRKIATQMMRRAAKVVDPIVEEHAGADMRMLALLRGNYRILPVMASMQLTAAVCAYLCSREHDAETIQRFADDFLDLVAKTMKDLTDR